MYHHDVRANIIESQASIQLSTQLLRVIRTIQPAGSLTTWPVCVHLRWPSVVVMEAVGGVRRPGPTSPTCRDFTNSYANAKAPAVCRHCSPAGVPVSPGLTYYANFRKTLTGGTRVIDTYPLAAGEPVSEFLMGLSISLSLSLCPLFNCGRKIWRKVKEGKSRGKRGVRRGEEWDCRRVCDIVNFKVSCKNYLIK